MKTVYGNDIRYMMQGKHVYGGQTDYFPARYEYLLYDEHKVDAGIRIPSMTAGQAHKFANINNLTVIKSWDRYVT